MSHTATSQNFAQVFSFVVGTIVGTIVGYSICCNLGATELHAMCTLRSVNANAEIDCQRVGGGASSQKKCIDDGGKQRLLKI